MVSESDKEYFKRLGQAKKLLKKEYIKELKRLSPEERFVRSFKINFKFEKQKSLPDDMI